MWVEPKTNWKQDDYTRVRRHIALPRTQTEASEYLTQLNTHRKGIGLRQRTSTAQTLPSIR